MRTLRVLIVMLLGLALMGLPTSAEAGPPRAAGGYTSSQSNRWVFNNIVMFGSSALR